jgi:hypothetical protein
MNRSRNNVFLFAVSILALLIAACGSPGESPVINSFTADAETITVGDSVILSWSISGATQAEITPNVGAVTATQGSETVTPTETTAYVLRASNRHGSATRTVTITVTPDGEPGEPVVTSVTVSPAESTLQVGTTRELAAAVQGEGDFDDTVTWSSSDDEIASVSESGLVTAVAEGTATITATSNETPGVTGTATVIVTTEPVETEVTAVTVTPATASLAPGATQQLNASVTGTGDYDDTVTWSSSDDAIATVSDSGLVTAVAEGTATITATSNETPEVAGTAAITVTAISAEVCTDPEQVVTFPDPLLEAAVRALFQIPEEPLTCFDVQQAVPSEVNDDGQEINNVLLLNRTESPEKVMSLEGLQHLTSLVRLELEGNNLTDADIGVLSSLTSLTELSLDSNDITDLTPLSGLSNLTVLGFYDNEVEDLGPLAELTNLEIIYASENRINSLAALSGLTNLQHLWLFDNCRGEGFSDCITDISPLAGLTALESLIITTNEVADISAVATMTSLRLLHAASNQISDISALGSLTELETVRIDDNPIASLEPLAINLTFPGGPPFEFERGNVSTPLGGEPAYSNLMIGYNCLFVNEAANDAHLATITARGASVTIDDEDEVRTDCGEGAAAGMRILNASGVRQMIQQELSRDR